MIFRTCRFGLFSYNCMRRVGKVIVMRRMGLSSVATPSLTATPEHTLIDEKVQVQVDGVQAQQPLTLCAYLAQDGLEFTSHAHYYADAAGALDVSTAESQGGSYTGVEDMGLIWALKAVQPPGVKKGFRLMQRDVTSPMTVTYSALKGHVDATSPASHNISTDVLCRAQVRRSYLHPDVQRIEVREGRLRGTLFLPKGGACHEGVIDLFGTAGGLVEFRAALIASRGFAVFALAYFNFDDLPDNFYDIDLEYFEEAADWLLAHPRVYSHGCGIVGVSKGAELAIHLSCICKQFIATVAINGIEFVTWSNHYYKGETTIGYFPPIDRVKMTEWGTQWDDVYSDECQAECEIKPTMFKVEEADQTHFLLVHGEDDLNVPPRAAKAIPARLKDHGKDNCTVLLYPGAGHLIEPPYSPFTHWSYHSAFSTNITWGGDMVAHSRAQEDAWPKILSLLHNRLTPNKSKL